MNQSKKTTDGALLIAVFIVLMLIAIFVPIISLIAMIFLPLPFVVYAYRYDWRPSIIVLIAAIILSSLFATIITIPLTLLVGLGGIMLGTAIHHKLPAYETLARGTLGFIAGLMFIFLFSQLILDVNWMSEMDQVMDESIEMSNDLMNQFGFPEQTEEERAFVEEKLLQFKNLLPVGLALAAIFMSFVTQWLSYKVLNRLEREELSFPPLRSLKFPVAIVWIYLIALILTFFDIDRESVFYLGIHNIHALVGLLIAMQGFSFIFFYAHYKKRSNIIPIISVIITIVLPFPLLYLVRIIGIIDIGYALRDRINSKE